MTITGRRLKATVDYLLGAHGHTCKGSGDGVVSAMDGVNRWRTEIEASARGAWIVITREDGRDILVANDPPKPRAAAELPHETALVQKVQSRYGHRGEHVGEIVHATLAELGIGVRLDGSLYRRDSE